VIVERLDMIDEAAHCLSYALLSNTPFGSYLTTLALQALKCFNDPQITINSDFPNTKDGIAGLKREILGNPIYAGKVILIC
jgi:hypothetical protein